MNILGKVEELRAQGKKIGFTASTFDLMHPGHIAMLAESRANCDFLIVGLLTDPTISRPLTKERPIQTIFERFIQAQAISSIDYLIPFETEEDLEQLLLMLMPNIRFVGEEYMGADFTAKDISKIEIFYNKRRHGFSSSDLRERISK